MMSAIELYWEWKYKRQKLKLMKITYGGRNAGKTFLYNQLRDMTHDQLQAECCTWLWNYCIGERLMWHHNNNNSVSRSKGATMKALGVVAGVWDFEWTTPRGWQIWIDFKVGYDRLSERQIEFRDKMQLRNRMAFFFIVENLEQFKDIIWKNI